MKNRRFAGMLLVVLLVQCFAIPAFAAGKQVKDTAGVLTGAELARLEDRAVAISEEYDFGIYIRLMKDFKAESSFTKIEPYTVDVYDSEGLGKGEDLAGTMIVLSLADRDFYMDFNSSRADYAFTEPGRDLMEERILPYFGRDDYYGGFSEYLNVCEEYLKSAREGDPVGGGALSSTNGKKIGLFAVIPGAIAAIVIGIILSAPMHSAGQKRNANAYIVKGSLELQRRSDMFLRRSVSRRPRPTQSSNTHSSGSSHHYSSGSHSGRSGKF